MGDPLSPTPIAENSARRRRGETGKDGFDRIAIRLEPRRQNQRFAERSSVFVDGETGTIGGELEEHAAGFAEVNRLEPKAIDHRGRLRAGTEKIVAHGKFLRVVRHARGKVMNRARAPGATAFVRRSRLKIELRTGSSLADAGNPPAIFFGNLAREIGPGKKGGVVPG